MKVVVSEDDGTVLEIFTVERRAGEMSRSKMLATVLGDAAELAVHGLESWDEDDDNKEDAPQ